MRCRTSSLLLLLSLWGCSCEKDASTSDRGSAAVLLETVPPAFEPKITLAKAAIAELGKTLSGRLTQVLGAEGPQEAMAVCAKEAQALTRDVAKRNGIELGRTSHKLRNPDNAPRPWVQPWLGAHAGTPAGAARPAIYDLGERLGILVPIATGGMCTTCHGQDVDSQLWAKIRSRYPKDEATGFAAGDLRGAFWAEVPK